MRFSRKQSKIIVKWLTENDLSSYLSGDVKKDAVPDEIHTLCHMIESSLPGKYSAELLKKQTELSILQSQINPHFLYNSLEAIRSQALKNNEPHIAEAAKNLSKFFRYSISSKDDIVTIQEELDNIAAYFHIVQFRFENRFRLEVQIQDEKALQCVIPQLSFQPIIENALYHGLEQRCDGGTIRIGINSTEKKLYITISDNGIGMEPEKLLTINQRLHANIGAAPKTSNYRSTGIALYNANARIKLYFGNEFGIHLSSVKNLGTQVEIIIPYQTEKKNVETLNATKHRHEILRLSNISTAMPDSRQYLKNFCLSVFTGEIVGLLGFQGSGNSLIKPLLEGKLTIHDGSVFLDEMILPTYREDIALQQRIISVDSQSSLVNDLTIAENIFVLKKELHFCQMRMINNKKLLDKSRPLLDTVGLQLPASTPVYQLSFLEKQLVCIAKAIAQHARLITVDYTAHSFSHTDYEKLTHVFDQLTHEGISILLIDDRPNPLVEHCDRIIFLQDGYDYQQLVKTEISNNRIMECLNNAHERSCGSANIAFQTPDCIRNLKTFQITSPGRKPILSVSQGQAIGFYDSSWDFYKSFREYLHAFSSKNKVDFLLDGISLPLNCLNGYRSKNIAYVPNNSARSLPESGSIGEHLALPVMKSIFPKSGMMKKYLLSHMENQFKLTIGLDPSIQDLSFLTLFERKLLTIFRWGYADIDVLILENPMDSVDAIGIQKLQYTFDFLAEKNITLLISCQNLYELDPFCKWIICSDNALFFKAYAK